MSNFLNESNVQAQSEFDDNNQIFMANDNLQHTDERGFNDRMLSNNDEMQQFANNVLNEMNNNQHVQNNQLHNEVEQNISPEYLYKEQELLLSRQMVDDKNNIEIREQPISKINNNNLLSLYKPLSVVLIFLLLNNSIMKKNIGKYLPKLINNNELNTIGLVIMAIIAGLLYYVSHNIILRS
jgi:hypothetical protein